MMSAPHIESVGIPGHDCNVYCRDDEHCELVWSSFDHHPGRAGQDPPYESVRRHYDEAYRHHYGARVVRVEPAREPRPIETMDQRELTPLVGGGGQSYAWLVWVVGPGEAAAAFAEQEEAAWQAKISAARHQHP